MAIPTGPRKPRHPGVARRTALQVGGIGLLGLGTNHVGALRALAESETAREEGNDRPKAVIYIFLSGGLTQHDSFDPKPNAPDAIRGEFSPIATKIAGIHVCEHLPLLAERSDKWALVRSLSHSSNGHSAGHHIMLTGHSHLPRGFNGSKPLSTDHPSIASVAGYLLKGQNNLPSAAVLPYNYVHHSGHARIFFDSCHRGIATGPRERGIGKVVTLLIERRRQKLFIHSQRECQCARKQLDLHHPLGKGPPWRDRQ